MSRQSNRSPLTRTRRRALLATLLALLALAVALAGVAVAQEEPAPETPPAETPPAQTPPAETPPAEAPAAETPPVATPPAGDQPVVGTVGKGEAPSDDPADDVVKHVKAMTRIVRDHIDEPDKVKTDLKAYIDQNAAAMKDAGDRFEARLNDLPADEREAYKEKLQRKMETSLADFLEAMLDFSERHPEAARELDEMLQAVQ